MIEAILPPSTLATCVSFHEAIAEKGLMKAIADRAAEHAAERALTTSILFFELFVVGAAVVVFLLLLRSTEKPWRRMLAMAVGVFLFELFTGPMWINEHMGRWAYVYDDLSWILTLGWATMILGVVVLVDRRLSHWSEPKRFAVYLGILLVLVTAAEMAVVGIGIRKYSPEVLATVSGIRMFGVPVELLYYVPVFTTLVIAFYKYWSFVIDAAALVPVKKRKWLRAVVLVFAGVFMFEVLVEPMVRNEHFPAWSYVYNDISFLMTGTWVLLIAVGAVVIERFMIGLSIPLRFAASLLLIGTLILPIESWLIAYGYRVYGESTAMNFSGFNIPMTGVPIEVAFAVPCYLALIVGFVRYWEIVLDNKL
jgi:hypothetical protein